jgi:rhamnosyltransferase
MVAALCEEIDPAVAVVGAFALDRNLEDEPPDAQADAEDVDSCITAGSLCRVAAWQEIAGYDERLFIDFVDFDFCLRLRMAGWRIRITPHAILSHEVGLGRRHEGDVAYNHSAFRSFHLARDMILYARIHRGAPRDLMVEPRGLAATVRALVHRMRTVARFEQDATAKVSALMRGLLQGLVTPLGERPSGTC